MSKYIRASRQSIGPPKNSPILHQLYISRQYQSSTVWPEVGARASTESFSLTALAKATVESASPWTVKTRFNLPPCPPGGRGASAPSKPANFHRRAGGAVKTP